jgi:hypothetical protein
MERYGPARGRRDVLNSDRWNRCQGRAAPCLRGDEADLEGVGGWHVLPGPRTDQPQGRVAGRLDIEIEALGGGEPQDFLLGQAFEVGEIRFDPVAKGKNAVEVQVRNVSDTAQSLDIHVYSMSLIGPGGVGRGWGTRYGRELPATREAWVRLPFRIQADVTENTSVRLRFYDSASKGGEEVAPFQESTVLGGELEHLDGLLTEAQAADPVLDRVIRDQLAALQSQLAEGDYPSAWASLTREYRQATYFDDVSSFSAKMGNDWLPYGWTRTDFVGLAPQSVQVARSRIVLRATLADSHWMILFVKEEGQWKVDWVGGYADSRAVGDVDGPSVATHGRSFDAALRHLLRAELEGRRGHRRDRGESRVGSNSAIPPCGRWAGVR